MREKIKEKIERLKDILDFVVSTDSNGREYRLDRAIEKSIYCIISVADHNGKIMIIGNGASAAIASHIAVDFWKMRAYRQ